MTLSTGEARMQPARIRTASHIALRAALSWSVAALLVLLVRAGGWRPFFGVAVAGVFVAVAVTVFALARWRPAAINARTVEGHLPAHVVVGGLAAVIALVASQAIWARAGLH